MSSLRTAVLAVAALSVLCATATAQESDARGRLAIEARPGGASLRGPGYEAQASADGFRIRMRHSGATADVGYRLETVRAGASVLFSRSSDAPVVPAVRDGVVAYVRGGIVEMYEPRANGVEQLFRIDAPLPADSGLRIEGRFETAHRASCRPGHGVEFRASDADEHPLLTYGEPVLIDASGRRIPGRLALDGASCSIAFDASDLAGLTYPITIDPLFGSAFLVASSVNNESAPSIAWNSSSGLFLVTYEVRVGTSTDYDIWGQHVTTSGTLSGSPFAIQATSGVVERNPRVAYSPDTNRYAVVYDGDGNVRMATLTGSGAFLASYLINGSSKPPFGASFSPSIVYQGNDRFMIVWAGYSVSKSTLQFVYAERRDSNGAWASPVVNDAVIQSVVTTAAQFKSPCVAYDSAQDRFLFAWTHTDGSIRAVLKSADLSTIYGPVTLSTVGDSSSVAWVGNLNLYAVVWQDKASSTGDILLNQISGSTGKVVGSAIIANTTDTEATPSIAYGAWAGELLVTWIRVGFGGTLMAQSVRSDGVLRGSAMTVSGLYSASQVPAVGWDETSSHRFLCSYMTGKYANIYGQLVTPVNSPPTANGQSVATSEDTNLAITLSGSDPDSDPLTYAVATQPAHGTVSGPGSSVTYYPAANYSGPDSFSFTVNDGSTSSSAATVSINVTAVNDAPSFTKGADQYVLEENSAQIVVGWATAISPGPADEAAQAVDFVVTNDNNPLFSAQPAISAAGTLTYTPAANANGSATVTVQIHDNGGTVNGGVDTSAAQTFTINVTAVNDAPSFAKGADQNVLEDASAQTVVGWATAISAGPADESGQVLDFVVTNDNNALFSVQPAISAAGTLTYTPEANASGSATVTVQLHDNGGIANGGVDVSAPQTFTIAATPVNDAPVAQGATVTATEDTPKSLTLAASDADGDLLTYSIVSGPWHGTLTGTGANRVYTPDPNYNATDSQEADSFVFRVKDPSNAAATATVYLEVAAVNDTPTAIAQALVGHEDAPLSISLTGLDAEGSALTYTVTSQPAHGTLAGTPPNVTFTPTTGFQGSDAFAFTVSDGTLTSRPATVSMTVAPADRTPTADPMFITLDENTAREVTLTGSDPDNDSLTFRVEALPAHGTLTGAPPNLTYSPALNYDGSDSFTYTAFDGWLRSSEATVSITVNDVDQPPTANSQTVNFTQNTPIQILLTGEDPDGDTLYFSRTTEPLHGTLSGSEPDLTYTPEQGYVGPDGFQFVITAGGKTSNVATVNLNVTNPTADYTFDGFTGDQGPYVIIAQAEGVTVTVSIPTSTSGSVAAHLVAASLTASNVNAAAWGHVLTIVPSTSTVTAVYPDGYIGISIDPLPQSASGIYAAAELTCCRRESERAAYFIDGLTEEVDSWSNSDGWHPPSSGQKSPWPCQEPYRGDLQIGSGVFAHSGEFGYQKSLLHIAGRGMDYDFILTYRSGSPHVAPDLGEGWSHNWRKRLVRTNGDNRAFVITNGYGRADVYFQQSLADPTNYVDGPGVFRMVINDGAYAYVRDRFGTTEVYAIGSGLLDHVTDRNGNTISFRYTKNCNVESVTDTLGRMIKYEHEEIRVPRGAHEAYEERLVRVRDHTGRVVALTYAETTIEGAQTKGDLIAITTPGVPDSQAAPGNSFPLGKTTWFTYDTTECPTAAPSSSCQLEALTHNMLTVREPGDEAGTPTIVNVYGNGDPLDANWDRVIEQEVGSEGGLTRKSYFSYERDSQNPQDCANLWITQIDPRGHMRKYFIDALGHLRFEDLYTELATPDGFYRTEYFCNDDGLVTVTARPDGTVTVNTFYAPSGSDPADRIRRGNRVMTTTLPEPSSGLDPITEFWEYEPQYNQVSRHTSPRGNEMAYTYDHEVNPSSPIGGNVVRIDYPTVILADGQTTQSAFEAFTYNSNGQELTHRRAEGNVDTSVYEAGYLRIRTLDASHETGANSNGIAGPASVRTEYTRDALGRVTAQTDGRGIVTETDYNPLDQVWRVRTPAAGLETLTYYDARDRVVRVSRKIGNADTPDDDGYASTFYAYDRAGNRVSEASEVSPGVTATLVMIYDDDNNLVTRMSPECVIGRQPGNRVDTEFDELHRPSSVTEAAGTADARTTSFTYYFTSKQVTSEIDGRGYPTWRRYDGFGRLSEVEDPLHGVRTTEYDEAGNVIHTYFMGDAGPVRANEAGGGTPQNVLLSEEFSDFDERDRKIRTRTKLFRRAQPLLGETQPFPIFTDGDADGIVQTATTLDREGRAILVTNDRGNSSQVVYDGMGRAVVAIDALGNEVQTTYDPNGNPTEIISVEQDALGVVSYVTTSYFDAANRKTSSIDNAGGVSYVTYDALGLVTATLDQEGNAVQKFYDASGRNLRTDWVLTASGTGPGGGAIGAPDSSQGGGDGRIREETGYDLNGRVVVRRDDNGNETSYQYSNRSQVIVETLADGSVLTTHYDANGNADERVDANGTTVTQAFDALNRVVSVLAVPAQNNPYGVVEGSTQTFAYDGLSRMVQATDSNFSAEEASRVDYVYDSLTRVISERQSHGLGTPASFLADVDAQFNGMGGLVSLTYPGNRLIQHTFDELERLKTVDEGAGSIVTYTYAGPSRVVGVAYSNGTNLEIGHDALKRPTSWSHADSVQAFADFAYGYDRVGNRRFERRAHEANHGKQYGYDSAYRLLDSLEGEIDTGGGLVTQTNNENYAYDGVGNRTNQAKGATLTSYAINELNQYTQFVTQNVTRTLSYDKNGNLLDDGEKLFRYDFLSRLRLVSRKSDSALLATYFYDGRGRRIRKDVTNAAPELNGRTTFLYHDSRVIEERDASFALAATHTYGIAVDEVLQKVTAAATTFYHGDALGSVVAVTSAVGAVLERYHYEAYGAPTILAADGQTVRTVSAVGNRYLFTGREFEAESGLYFYRARYYSPELGRFLSRDPSGFVDGLNLYAYVLNNPPNRVDPTGNWGEFYEPGLDDRETMDAYNKVQAAVLPKIADVAADFTPVVGDAKGVIENVKDGNYVMAVVAAAPGPLEKVAKYAGKAYKAVKRAVGFSDEAVDAAKAAGNAADAGKAAGKVDNAGAPKVDVKPPEKPGDARFVADDKGNVVDTQATPPGRYIQPDKSATDVLQQAPHKTGADGKPLDPFTARTHTHDSKVNVNPKDPSRGSTTLNSNPRPVTAEDVQNIMDGTAKPSTSRGR